MSNESITISFHFTMPRDAIEHLWKSVIFNHEPVPEQFVEAFKAAFRSEIEKQHLESPLYFSITKAGSS